MNLHPPLPTLYFRLRLQRGQKSMLPSLNTAKARSLPQKKCNSHCAGNDEALPMKHQCPDVRRLCSICTDDVNQSASPRLQLIASWCSGGVKVRRGGMGAAGVRRYITEDIFTEDGRQASAAEVERWNCCSSSASCTSKMHAVSLDFGGLLITT